MFSLANLHASSPCDDVTGQAPCWRNGRYGRAPHAFAPVVFADAVVAQAAKLAPGAVKDDLIEMARTQHEAATAWALLLGSDEAETLRG